MPFQTALTSPDYTKLRGNHSIQTYVVANPNTVVFKCRINQATFASSVSEFTYDTVTIGTSADAKVGYTVYVSHTDNIRQAFFVGRVRKSPTSSILYINRTSAGFDDNDFVFIVKDIRLMRKDPKLIEGGTGTVAPAYFDEDIAFRQLIPLVQNLQTAYVVYLASGVADIALAPTGLATTSSASISTWAWDSDGGTFQVGSSSTQNVTIRYTSAGVYYPRVTVTDNGGRSNWFSPMVAVVDLTTKSSPMVLGITGASVSGALNNGWNAQISARAGSAIASMLDGTQIVIFGVEQYGDSQASLLSNVKFVGRLRNETQQMQVTEYGIIGTVSLQAEGLQAQLGGLRLATIAIRENSSPNEYGEVASLTVWRAISLIATELTTLTHFCSVAFASTDTTYRIERVGTSKSEKAFEMFSGIAESINAPIVFSPQGEMMVARDINYVATASRGSATVVAQFSSTDWIGALGLKFDHRARVGSVIAYGGSYTTSTNKTTVLRAIAPSSAWGDGETQKQLNRQVLESDLSESGMRDAIALRAGAEYSMGNPRYELTVKFPSGYNFLVPTNHQRWGWTILASDTERGVGFASTDYWLLEAINIVYEIDGSRASVSATFNRETTPVDASVLTEFAASAVISPTPILPTLPSLNPRQWKIDPLINYPVSGSAVPADEDKQSFSPASFAASVIVTQETAEEIAQALPEVGCDTLSVYMNNPSAVATSWNTTVSRPYILTTSGYGKYSNAGWTHTFDFTQGSFNWSPFGAYATYVAGVGFKRGVGSDGGFNVRRIYIQSAVLGTSYTLTRIQVNWNAAVSARIKQVIVFSNLTSVLASYLFGDGLSQWVVEGLNIANVKKFELGLSNDPFSSPPDPSFPDSWALTSITLSGTGSVDPYAAWGGTSSATGTIYADSYYKFGQGISVPELLPSGSGMLFDGVRPNPIPLYNSRHVYAVNYTGTGYPLQAKFGDTGYSDNGNNVINVQICRSDGLKVP